jgi:two-component system sensor histidine kinase BaeS
MAGIIHEEAERLNARLNDLLYLAELESGQLVLHEDQINLGDVIAKAAARIAPDVGRRDIMLTVHTQEQSVVRTDGQKLERVIENLLDNARKFTPGKGSIAVRQGTDDDHIWIEIANTAGGLEPEELPRLFDRFYRRERGPATDGYRRRQAGSGLGLPIARDLAGLLGGRLEASLRDGELVMRLALPSDSSASAKALSEVEDVPPSALR